MPLGRVFDLGKASDHWGNVYRTKAPDTVSWFQPDPQPDLALILAEPEAAAKGVIDIGAGMSFLAERLIDAGVGDVTLLDISDTALAGTRARLAARGAKVATIAADICRWDPPRRWGIWHDRAVFHFLTEPADQDAYLRRMAEATEPGAVAVISTFADDGPEKCSGLPVARYSAPALAARLGPDWTMVHDRRVTHVTPSGGEQRFIACVFRRAG
jgi:SAM-dependent methyltransferase